MLIDANELADESSIECDICIAGSGPAGITIARELAGEPVRVCLIECGGLSPREAKPTVSSAEQKGLPLDPFQRHCVGGGSNWWGGMRGTWFRSKPLDPLDFEVRTWVPNSGWPFGHEALAPYIERAGLVLGVPRPEDRILEAVREQFAPEFNNDELRTTVFQLTRPMRLGQHHLALLEEAARLSVYLHARVVEIVEDPGAPVIRHIRIASGNGRTHTVSAARFVLACGGLENPRLLLASRSKAERGIGNEHDLVGRYYMHHPKGLSGFAVLKAPALRAPLYTRGYQMEGSKLHGAIMFSEDLQRREGLLNHCAWFKPIYSLSESYAALAYRAAKRARHDSECPNTWRREFMYHAGYGAKLFGRALAEARFSTMFAVSNHMEQIPSAESRLTLSERTDSFGLPQLRTDWRIDALAKQSLQRLHRLLHERLALQSAGRLKSDLDPLAEHWPITANAAHHLGTTRMHADPKRGVTDPDGRVHGLRNLYVSGGSLFPTGGHANPTLTIVALAIRLADHLKRL